jgi:hypothetical protein
MMGFICVDLLISSIAYSTVGNNWSMALIYSIPVAFC